MQASIEADLSATGRIAQEQQEESERQHMALNDDLSLVDRQWPSMAVPTEPTTEPSAEALEAETARREFRKGGVVSEEAAPAKV